MKFEEEFPSLEGKAKLSITCVTKKIGDDGVIFRKYDIQRYCLDKQKVKKAIERIFNLNFSPNVEQRLLEDEYDRGYKDALDYLKEDLGLDE